MRIAPATRYNADILGVSLALVSLGLFAVAFGGGGAWLVVSWPALSFGLVSVGYFGIGPAVFQKRSDGTLPLASWAALGPYLAFTLALWHVVRVLSREAPSAELSPSVRIGRRLLGHELAPDFASVVDLTSEFAEPREVAAMCEYFSAPMLDGAPTTPERLSEIIRAIQELPQPLYIHCAQGHGRTAMVAAAYLIATGDEGSVESALARVQSVRPAARPRRTQICALRAFADSCA